MKIGRKDLIIIILMLMALAMIVGTLSQPDRAYSEETTLPQYYVSIEKSADDTDLTLALGQVIEVTYMIKVSVNETKPDVCHLVFNPGDCVRVTDTNFDELDEIICYDDGPSEYNYTYGYEIGPYEECGEYLINNLACIERTSTPVYCCSKLFINVHVPCYKGCTLTPGYWKTHSKYGPAPYDDTWELLGEDTMFFLSDQSYYDVLWTPPKGGNAYFILAHAYIAAELNMLNNASIPDNALNAWNEATNLFATYAPDQVALLKGKSGNETRTLFIELAEILDTYNNGLIGPGHCSE